VTLAALGVAGAIAIGTAAASASGESSSATIKIPLPAPDQAKVSLVTVKVTAPKGKKVGAFKVIARNAAALGGPQLNTQAIAVVGPPSSNKQTATFRVYVFIHRFPAVAADRGATAAAQPELELGWRSADEFKFIVHLGTSTCAELSKVPLTGTTKTASFLDDSWIGAKQLNLTNLVPSFDTAAEEQVDGAMSARCPGAEKPDPGAR
jgi:hypothetical protein